MHNHIHWQRLHDVTMRGGYRTHSLQYYTLEHSINSPALVCLISWQQFEMCTNIHFTLIRKTFSVKLEVIVNRRTGTPLLFSCKCSSQLNWREDSRCLRLTTCLVPTVCRGRGGIPALHPPPPSHSQLLYCTVPLDIRTWGGGNVSLTSVDPYAETVL